MRQDISSVPLLSAKTTTGAGEIMEVDKIFKTFHALGTTSAGSGAATIVIEASDKNSVPTADTEFVTLGTISLTLGTTQTGDGFAVQAAWRYIRARVSAISGTNASVDVYMGG